jgi:glucose-6-phosphate isomerase
LVGLGLSSSKWPRFHFVNDIDPDATADLLKSIDWRRTVVHLVSKGGDSPELLSHFYIARDRLQRALPSGWRKRLLFTLESKTGTLYQLCKEGKHPLTSFPESLSGRFALFSDVGLLPAAVAGIDIRGLLRGAAWMDETCKSATPSKNPALLAAGFYYLAAEQGLRTSVIMPYHRNLLPAADYFRFLWAGSLGKRKDLKGKEVFKGLTPLVAIGMEDQHSQLQLFAEGPFDKTVTFMTLDNCDEDVRVPAPDQRSLKDRTLADVNAIWAESTARSLAAQGRPNATLSLPRLDAYWLGALLYYHQRVTLYVAELFGVNPDNQPGVALGKRFAAERLEGPGVSAEAPQPVSKRSSTLFLDFSPISAAASSGRSGPGKRRHGQR